MAIVCFSMAKAQNDKPNREAFALKVQVNSTQFYAQQIGAVPYFAEENMLQIYPDELVYIEAEVANGEIVGLKSVKENLRPENTFEVEFCQTIENNIVTSSQLFLKNPFDKKLKYNGILYVIDTSKWKEENHSVKAKSTGLQTWKPVLGSIVIKDWQLE